jgi:hypothetical protein
VLLTMSFDRFPDNGAVASMDSGAVGMPFSVLPSGMSSY